ncbi:MAG: hypothetical protein U0Z26_03550 [Anaerolineales bacterium]
MKKKLRLFFAVIVLTFSISLLIWGYWPNQHEIKVQSISSSEMQLPVP